MFLSRLFSLFFKGTHCSMIFSISYFRMFQQLIAVLFLSMLFQSSLVKYLLISLYLPFWKFRLNCFFLLFLVYFVNVFDDNHCYPMAHVFLYCPLIHFVKTKLYIIHSLPLLVLICVE